MGWGVCHEVSLVGLNGGCDALISLLKPQTRVATFSMIKCSNFASLSHLMLAWSM